MRWLVSVLSTTKLERVVGTTLVYPAVSQTDRNLRICALLERSRPSFMKMLLPSADQLADIGTEVQAQKNSTKLSFKKVIERAELHQAAPRLLRDSLQEVRAADIIGLCRGSGGGELPELITRNTVPRVSKARQYLNLSMSSLRNFDPFAPPMLKRVSLPPVGTDLNHSSIRGRMAPKGQEYGPLGRGTSGNT